MTPLQRWTTRRSDPRARLVVVGNGMAGARCVEEVLERGGGEQFAITVFGDEPHGNYNRIMLSQVLAGEEHEDDIVLNSHDWYADNGITLRAGVRVERIDTARQASSTPTTGRSRPTTTWCSPPAATRSSRRWPGVRRRRRRAAARGVRLPHHRRDAGDARGHGRCTKAVVMGGGLLGLEAARALQGHGLQVELVHADAVADERAARRRGRSDPGAERRGPRHHRAPRRPDHRGAAARTASRACVLKDGRRLDCDLLVVAAGIRPHTDVALRSGLEVQRAIVVDDQLRTDDPDVYAIGECAQHRGEVYGLVAPAWEHARVLADVLTGTDPDAEYHGSRDRHQAQGRRRRRRRHGREQARAGRRRVPASSPSRGAACTCRWSSATTSWSARRCSATPARSPS